ncbi:hypothetical protein AAVH_20986 [Aphelenchoides avenae]|nr:hypothetical protein AAVH_20986 [Aphelenchus avenae]
MRLPYYVFLPKELLESGYYGTVMFAVLGYTGVFQFFAHTAIAINRFSVVRWPLKHKMIWSGKRLRYVLAFLFLAPLSGIVARFFTLLRVILTDSGYKIVYDNNSAFLANFGSGLTLSLLTSVTSICFELRTLVLFRRLSTSSRRHYQQDYRLLRKGCPPNSEHYEKILVFSFLTFTTQLLITIFYVMQLVYLTGGSVVIAQLAQKMYPYISDLSCLGGSPCLFVTSGMVRKDYLEYYSLKKRCRNVSWVSSSAHHTLRSSSVHPQTQRIV